MIEDLGNRLREKRYKFSAVRRVDIPKASGGTRPLGIATVRDRVVQTAMKIVLEPIFEADFHDCSYGYRPKRSAPKASWIIREDMRNGHVWGVVEVDLKSYFTSIPHNKLMKLITMRIADGSLLKLIKQTLKVAVTYQGKLEPTKVGVPQGSPLSPLYSNIYLNVLDRVWHARKYPEKLGASLHRYADDMVLICRKSDKVALGAMVAILKRMDLTLNREKTKTTGIKEGFNFIGYEFVRRKSQRLGKSANYIFPSKQSQRNIRDKIRAMTNRRAPIKPDEFLGILNSVVRGWAEYHRYTHGASEMRRMQRFITNRTRRYLNYRTKRLGFGFDRYPDEKLYSMGLIQIHSGWVKPPGTRAAHAIR
jgi:group II intron reverse transcriptase/maturase